MDRNARRYLVVALLPCVELVAILVHGIYLRLQHYQGLDGLGPALAFMAVHAGMLLLLTPLVLGLFWTHIHGNPRLEGRRLLWGVAIAALQPVGALVYWWRWIQSTPLGDTDDYVNSVEEVMR